MTVFSTTGNELLAMAQACKKRPRFGHAGLMSTFRRAKWGFDSPRLYQFPVYTRSFQPLDHWLRDGVLDLDVLRSMPQGMVYRDVSGSSQLTW
jgi:hypothetical protein